MIAHHLTLEHVARELSSMLNGTCLVGAWSQQKYVATLVFADQDREIPVVADVSGQDASITTRSSAHRAHRNSIDVFADLVGQRLGAVVKLRHDRVVSFVFEHHVLHVELFSGGRGNLVLCDQMRITDALRNRSERIGTEFTVSPPMSTELFARSELSLRQDLSTCSMHLGRQYAEEVCRTAAVDGTKGVATLSQSQRDLITYNAHQLRERCLESRNFLMLAQKGEIILSLIPLGGWQIASEYTSILEAVRDVSARRRAQRSFQQERQRRLRAADTLATKLQRTLAAVLADEAAPVRSDRYRSWADTLMAQPDVQSSGHDSRETINVVTGVHERIPLKPDLTILENATALYSKARDAEAAARRREQRLPELQRRLQEINDERRRIEEATQMAELPRTTSAMDSQQQQAAQPKFREFRLDESHTLYIGRNASNNDELTMKFARQQDWWMHVRGASGSHAVLRGVSGPKIPKQILEAAAAITAYYSQARNASYVPVVYTQRKYVRKPKGANVGAVVIDREQTVMVRPGLPEGSVSEE